MPTNDQNPNNGADTNRIISQLDLLLTYESASRDSLGSFWFPYLPQKNLPHAKYEGEASLMG